MKTVLSIIFSLFMLNSFSQTENTWKHSNGNFKISDEKLNELVTEEVEDYFKNHPDLMDDIVSKGFAKSVDEIDINIIMKYISQKPELSKIIDEVALKVVKENFDSTSVKVYLEDVFAKAATDSGNAAIKNIPDNIKSIIDMPISSRNADGMKNVLKQQQELLSTLKNVDGVADLQRQIQIKLDQIAEFENEINRINPKQD